MEPVECPLREIEFALHPNADATHRPWAWVALYVLLIGSASIAFFGENAPRLCTALFSLIVAAYVSLDLTRADACGAASLAIGVSSVAAAVVGLTLANFFAVIAFGALAGGIAMQQAFYPFAVQPIMWLTPPLPLFLLGRTMLPEWGAVLVAAALCGFAGWRFANPAVPRLGAAAVGALGLSQTIGAFVFASFDIALENWELAVGFWAIFSLGYMYQRLRLERQKARRDRKYGIVF